jgi:hypothetical protein
MTNDAHYQELKERFRSMSDEELINAFNDDVGKHGWVSARASYHGALRDEFENRGYDYSAISNNGGFSLKRRIKLTGKKITLAVDW